MFYGRRRERSGAPPGRRIRQATSDARHYVPNCGVGRPAVRYLLRSPNCPHSRRLGLDIPPIEGGLASILPQHRDGARIQRKVHAQVQVEP